MEEGGIVVIDRDFIVLGIGDGFSYVKSVRSAVADYARSGTILLRRHLRDVRDAAAEDTSV